MSDKIFRACIMGASLETGNRGVSALAASLAGLVEKVKPGSRISFLVGNKEPKIRHIDTTSGIVETKVVNYRLSLKAKFNEHLFWIFLGAVTYRFVPLNNIKKRILIIFPWLNELVHADFIGNIHGGDSFSDIYGIGNFLIGIVPDFIAIIMKKKLVLLPQTYGPYSHKLSRVLARIIFNKSILILSRDKEGTQLVRNVQGELFNSHKIAFCPDVAFTLLSKKVLNARIKPQIDNDTPFSIIGINVNGLMYNGGYTKKNMFRLKCDYKKFLIDLIERFFNKTSCHVLLVPHTFGAAGNVNSDPDACRDLLNYFKGKWETRLHMVCGEYDQSEIKGIISLCNFFIGSRMHSCIAALSQGIPTIAIAYSKKFDGIFKSIGIEESVIDIRYLTNEKAINTAIDKYNKYFMKFTKIKNNIFLAQQRINYVFIKLLKADLK